MAARPAAGAGSAAADLQAVVDFQAAGAPSGAAAHRDGGDMTRLSETDKTRIEAAVAAAEVRTGAEFAVTVARASDRYAAFPLAWSTGLALAAGSAIESLRARRGATGVVAAALALGIVADLAIYAHQTLPAVMSLPPEAVHLPPEPAHVRLDDVGLGVEVKLPDAFKQHGARHHPARVPHQILQQLELAVLQVDPLARAAHRALAKIERQITDLQHGLDVLRGRPAGKSVHPGEQLRKSKGFH